MIGATNVHMVSHRKTAARKAGMLQLLQHDSDGHSVPSEETLKRFLHAPAPRNPLKQQSRYEGGKKMNSRKMISALLAGTVIAGSAFLGGCSKNQSSSSRAASSGSGAASSAASSAASAIEVEPIRIFMGTAGLVLPDGTSLSDNVYLNKIAELAHVKITEVICPAYSDFKTKLNLMFTSNDIPDLVHCWQPADIQTQGEAGAFMELSDVIASSAVLSKTYSKAQINLMKNANNHIFALRALAAKDANTAGVNMDLIDELNNGVVPTDPDGWYKLMKKEKEKYPDSVPMSARNGTNYFGLFFKAYGVNCYSGSAEWQEIDGKIENAFKAPLMKDAIAFYQKLYQEGLLDKTFITNTTEDFTDRLTNKKLLLYNNNANSMLGAPFMPQPLPRVNDPRVTDANAGIAAGAVGLHCVAVGAKTQHKAAVVRFIETLLSDNVKLLTSWGIEGTDYTASGSSKTLTDAGKANLNVRSLYRMMWNYGNDESVKMNIANNLAKVEESKRSAWGTRLNNALTAVYAQQAKVPLQAVDYIQLSTDTQTKRTEANEASKAIILKAIIGEITMAQYDQQVAEFLQKYQAITDDYNAKAPAMTAKLKG